MASIIDVRDALVAIRSGEAGAGADAGATGHSILVGAFANISGNPEDDWLGTGVSETLTADVGQLEGVTVVSRERLPQR